MLSSWASREHRDVATVEGRTVRSRITGLEFTLVLRVVFQGNRASSISVLRYGQEETFFAGREIVLSVSSVIPEACNDE